MAIRFVSGQSATTYDGTNFNDVSLTGVQTGSFLILAITGTTDQEVTGITSNSGTASLSSWTRAAGPYSGSGNAEGEIWWARVTSGGTVGVRPTGTGSDTGYSIHEFRNVSTGTPQIGSAQNVYVSGESAETGTISVTTGDLLFALYANESGDRTLTWGDGGSGSAYTQLENVTSHMHKTAYKIAGSDAAFSAECSWTSAFDPILMLVAFDAAPATEIIKVVDPDMGSGYDYDSLSDWEADLGGTTSGNLPADNEIAVAKCRCTGGTADGTAVSINGWATDATRYIKVWTDPAESYRHNGTYQTGNKYRIELSSIGTVLEVLEDYVKIYGIQIYNSSTGTGDNHPSVLRADTSAGAVIGFVIGRMNRNAGDYPHGIVSGGANSVVFNCVVYDVGTSSYGAGFEKWSTGSSGCLWYNNTAHNCHYGFRVPDDGCSSTTQITAKNCLAQDCDDGFYSSWTWNTASTNNCSDISSDAPGSNPQTGEVLFADEDNNDFHLSASDTVAKGVGINLYNDISYPFQDDIDGDDRGSTRDSDDFTNTNGTLLNTHNSLWDAAASTDISEIEIQGNAVVSNTTWGGGYAIYNNGQPANQTSQAVFKATASPKPETRSVIVRASSTTEGYRLKFEDTSGDNYTSLKLNKNGTWEYTFSSSGTWSCLVDHTLRLEVTTIGSDAVLTAFVDGVQVGSAHTDSSSPIASGYPGFSIEADATASSYALDSWESAVAWDIGADEYIDSYQLPVNRQYIRGATATWYEVVDVYVLKDGVFVPDKIIKILDSGSWI